MIDPSLLSAVSPTTGDMRYYPAVSSAPLPVQPQSLLPNATLKTHLPNLMATPPQWQAFSQAVATESLKTVPKKRLAVCFSGGPAPGGHTIVATIVAACHPTHEVWGIEGGFGGLLLGKLRRLSPSEVMPTLDTGGFDLLGTDRTKLHTPAHFQRVRAHLRTHSIDVLVVIGGDDSNTNAVFLADALLPDGRCVIGIPKTIDGDLRVPPFLPVSFGFDTACDHYSALVCALQRDTRSTKKYWHLVKLMGRSAGFVTQDVARRSRPDIALIGEDCAAKQLTFTDLCHTIGTRIQAAQAANRGYGVICFPESLLAWLQPDTLLSRFLTTPLDELPTDTHGNASLSALPTEQILQRALSAHLHPHLRMTDFQTHFFGYTGRCIDPTPTDRALCRQLALTATALALQGHTGLLAASARSSGAGRCYGIPLHALLQHETRGASTVAVIAKSTLATPRYWSC